MLDTYRCHMMRPVVDTIEDLGVEVQHIPGGCTSLCQPVNAGVNKPFTSSRMRRLWEEWMISSTGLNEGKITPPTGKDITEWSWSSTQDLPAAQMVRNAWQHGLYSYFPPPPDHAAAAMVANDTTVNEEEESTDDNESLYTDESTDYNESSDDDDHEVGHSEPLLSPARHGKDKNKNEEDIGSGDDHDDEVGSQSPFFLLLTMVPRVQTTTLTMPTTTSTTSTTTVSTTPPTEPSTIKTTMMVMTFHQHYLIQWTSLVFCNKFRKSTQTGVRRCM